MFSFLMFLQIFWCTITALFNMLSFFKSVSFVSGISGRYSTNIPLLCVCLSASSGSDSPDQALEAEEIVKQLDMEQPVETPTSTATSTQEMCATTNFYSSVSQLPPLRPPHIPEISPTAQEGELEADADLPPLTGTCCSWKCWWYWWSKGLGLPCYFVFLFLILFLLRS